MRKFDPLHSEKIMDLPINLKIDGYCDFCNGSIGDGESWQAFLSDEGLFIFHDVCYHKLLEKSKAKHALGDPCLNQGNFRR
jgi:hypothetical protein